MKDKLAILTRFVGRTKMQVGGSMPTVLTVGGIVLLVAAGVVAARNTQKMGEIVTDLEVDTLHVEDDQLAGNKTVDELARDKVLVWAKFAKNTAKLYAPAVTLGVAGAVAVLYSHGVMQKRLAALAAAYGVLEGAFEAYRTRVAESVGNKCEQEIYNGNVVRVTGLDEDRKKVLWASETPDNPTPAQLYTVEFDLRNKNWNGVRPELNLVFLRAQETYANHLLTTRGHVTLNDVFDGIGVPRTPAGQIVGWLRDGVDQCVDFGLPERGSTEESDFLHFWRGNGEDSIRLNFNVDGPIWESIGIVKDDRAVR